MTTDKMLAVSKTIRLAFDMGNNVPATWVEAYLLVYAAGDKGIRAQEIKDELGMTQGITSRMVSLLSLTFDPTEKKMVGKDFYDKQLDHIYKHQVRIFLSKEGKKLALEVEKLMK